MSDQDLNRPNQIPAPVPIEGTVFNSSGSASSAATVLPNSSQPTVATASVGFQSVGSNAQLDISPVQSPPKVGKPGFNFKSLIIILGALALLSVAGFYAWKTFIYKPVPQVAIITYWGFREKTPEFQKIISEYETENPNIKIEYIVQSKQDYRERLSNSIAQAKSPDIFEIHNTWLPMFLGQLSVLPVEVMDKNTYSNTYYPTTVNDLTQNGEIYGVPVNFDGLALFFNQRIFEASGKTPPTTWDELRQTAHELTIIDEEDNIQQSGIAMGLVGNVDHWQDILSLLMIQVGVNPVQPVGKLAEDTLSYFLIFAGEDRGWDESMPPSTKAFADEKTAMYLGPAYEIDNIKKINPNLSFKVTRAPQLAKDIPGTPNINWASYWAMSVSSKSKNQTDAWKFVNYLNQKSVIEKLNSERTAKGFVGYISPRVDMSDQFATDPLVGAFYYQAPTAKSWYMASDTFDGSTGINSRISNYYSSAINETLGEYKGPGDVLPIVSDGLVQVMSGYRQSAK